MSTSKVDCTTAGLSPALGVFMSRSILCLIVLVACTPEESKFPRGMSESGDTSTSDDSAEPGEVVDDTADPADDTADPVDDTDVEPPDTGDSAGVTSDTVDTSLASDDTGASSPSDSGDTAATTWFVDEDFEGGGAGTAVAGTGCWTCYSGVCDETFDDTRAHDGERALHTAGSNNAQLFCADPGFGADFGFSAWFWDDPTTGEDFSVVFQEERSTAGESGVVIRYNNITCPANRYCAHDYDYSAAILSTVDLGERAAGWHEMTATATYTSATTIEWVVCVDAACDSLSTDGYAIGTFRLHHDETETWADDFLAWSL